MTDHKFNSGMVTAYESNTRLASKKNNNLSTDWDVKIQRCFSQDYSFLPYTYSGQGIIFRGMNTGLLESIIKNQFGKFSSDNPHSSLEAELDVYFVSHELSDALTVSRLWELNNDACLLIIPSAIFIEKNLAKKAAVMAFSEPGFVFNYPFMTEPLEKQQLVNIIINHETYASLLERLDSDIFATIKPLLHIIDKKNTQAGRADVENHINDYLKNNKLQSARLIKAECYPKK